MVLSIRNLDDTRRAQSHIPTSSVVVVDRTCGFIVHTPEDTFLAHVFACDPSGGPLCKAVEAACKLRYQKFLDAHSKAMRDAQHKRTITPTEVMTIVHFGLWFFLRTGHYFPMDRELGWIARSRKCPIFS